MNYLFYRIYSSYLYLRSKACFTVKLKLFVRDCLQSHQINKRSLYHPHNNNERTIFGAIEFRVIEKVPSSHEPTACAIKFMITTCRGGLTWGC